MTFGVLTFKNSQVAVPAVFFRVVLRIILLVSLETNTFGSLLANSIIYDFPNQSARSLRWFKIQFEFYDHVLFVFLRCTRASTWLFGTLYIFNGHPLLDSLLYIYKVWQERYIVGFSRAVSFSLCFVTSFYEMITHIK